MRGATRSVTGSAGGAAIQRHEMERRVVDRHADVVRPQRRQQLVAAHAHPLQRQLRDEQMARVRRVRALLLEYQPGADVFQAIRVAPRNLEPKSLERRLPPQLNPTDRRLQVRVVHLVAQFGQLA